MTSTYQKSIGNLLATELRAHSKYNIISTKVIDDEYLPYMYFNNRKLEPDNVNNTDFEKDIDFFAAKWINLQVDPRSNRNNQVLSQFTRSVSKDL